MVLIWTVTGKDVSDQRLFCVGQGVCCSAVATEFTASMRGDCPNQALHKAYISGQVLSCGNLPVVTLGVGRRPSN